MTGRLVRGYSTAWWVTDSPENLLGRVFELRDEDIEMVEKFGQSWINFLNAAEEM